MPTDDMIPFPMFVGVPRSGTTLVLSMFDNHPDLVVPLLPGFILPMWQRRWRFGGQRRFVGTAFVDHLLSDPLRSAMIEDVEGLEEALRKAPPPDFATGIRMIYAALAASRGKPRYGDKTPAHVRHLPLLARLFPEARFVHIIRDGRDVAASMVSSEVMPRHPVHAAVLWNDWLRAGRRAGRRLGPHRYLELRYEELVAAPEPTLRRVCSFLDLPYDAAMLDYHRGAAERLRRAEVPELHANVRRPVAKNLRDWRRDLRPDQVVGVEVVAGDLLDELGYGRSMPAPGPVDRIRIQARAATMRLRNRLQLRDRTRRLIRWVGRLVGREV